MPLEEEDRGAWERAMVEEGMRLARTSLASPALGPHQLQAAIAATHADAATARPVEQRYPESRASRLRPEASAGRKSRSR